MWVFTPNCGSPICHVLLTVQNTHRRAALIHRQLTIYWIFTQTKLSSIYKHKLMVTYWALMKPQALRTIRQSSNLQVFFILLFGRKDSGEIIARVWQEEENFEDLKGC